MTTSVNNYYLANNYNNKYIINESFHDYVHLISRVFKPLPQEGKLSELAKRLSLVAAPLIYPFLGICSAIENIYYKLTRWYVSTLLETATNKIGQCLTQLNKGQGPYEFVVLFSIQSQGAILYSDLITLKSDQYANGQLPFFFEELKNKKNEIKQNFERACFNVGQNIEVKWEGFLQNGEGDFSSLEGNCSCNYMLISPSGRSGLGGGGYDNLEKIKNAFNERLQALKVTQPDKCQHFAV